MQLGRGFVGLAILAGLIGSGARAQDSYLKQGEVDVDFLLNYYTQDGNRSAVTGGEGTEEMDVVSSVIVVKNRINADWTLRSEVGFDGISSASVDNIDDAVSSASRDDLRAFSTVTGSRAIGNHTLTLTGGFSTEYDYQSFSAGGGWSTSFNGSNSSLATSFRVYSDTVEMYDIEGVSQGEEDRSTVDFSVGFSQVLGRRTLLSLELFACQQDGFLSAPFQEVILAPSSAFSEGERVAERLPDRRARFAAGLSLNHSFSKRAVQRVQYRFYDDDWGIRAQTVSLETHFRLPATRGSWVYPILRWHSQTAADYYGAPRTSSSDDAFYSADPDLSGFDSFKYGVGWTVNFDAKQGWKRRLRSFDTRLTQYSREAPGDEFDSFSVSLALGWRF